MLLMETAFEKEFQSVFRALVLISSAAYVAQGFIKRRYPTSSARFDRFAKLFSWAMVPCSLYYLFLFFRDSTLAGRMVIGFLTFVVIILISRYKYSRENESNRVPAK